MNFKALARNVSVAFFAQGVAMAVNIAVSLLVPKALGVEEYGYWQLFIFYASYVGFGHLGLNDGVYLINGGTKRCDIDKKSVNSQMVLSFSFQIIIALAILIMVYTGYVGPQRSFVITFTAIYMIIQNTANYLGFLFQAMDETRLYSWSCIIERIGFAVPMAVLLLCRVTSFQLYVIAYCFSSVLQLIYCLWHARDFLVSGLESPRAALAQAMQSVRVGIKLMLANIASQLILGVARFIIDSVWGIETFGELSLSLSLVNFFLAFISQASMVLFPALRQSDANDQQRFFTTLRDSMSLLFPVIYVLYFPICWFIGAWLPAYAASLVYFAYLMPVCVFDSKMDISCTTMFKVRREETTLFVINVITTTVSAIGSAIGAYVLSSINIVIACATIAIIARSVVSETILAMRMTVSINIRATVGELITTLLFILIATLCGASLLGMVLYSMVYILFAVLNKADYMQTISKIAGVVHSVR